MAKEKKKTKEKSTPEKTVGVVIPQIRVRTVKFVVTGQGQGLICHQMSPGTKRDIADKQEHKPVQKKGPRKPEEEYEDCIYRYNGGYGFPATAFKKSAVEGCTTLGSLTKIYARQCHHVVGDFVQLHGKPEMCSHFVRVQGKDSVPRYRALFPKWKVTLEILYNENAISPEQLVHLYNHAGFAVGVGDWRPEKGGSFGMFAIE
jgi:hypothetical protein